MWEKSFPITFHQMKIVHSITKDDKTWKKVLYNHSLSNLPIAQNKIKFMKKMHQSNFVNWRGTVKSNLSVIKSHTIVKLFLKSNPILGNKRNKKLGLFHIWPHCDYFFILRAEEKCYFVTVRKFFSTDRDFLLKLEAEGREFVKFLRSLEQFIQTVKGQNNFW